MVFLKSRCGNESEKVWQLPSFGVVHAFRSPGIRPCRAGSGDRYDSTEIQQNEAVGPLGGMARRAASHRFALIRCSGADDPSGKRP